MMYLSQSLQTFTAQVLNSIPEGILIAVFAWLLLKLAGRQNSGTRFAVWFASLVAIVLLPFLLSAPETVVHQGVTVPRSWATGILVLWGAGSFFAISRLVFGGLRLRMLRRNSVSIAAEELPVDLRQMVEEWRADRNIELRSSTEIRVPAAIGFFKPTILLPEWAVRELSAEELRTVVLHEYAHLERRDDWTNLAQKMVRAIFFFHPAVLWVEQRISLEREMACDDAVLSRTKNPHAYARCLISLAEKSLVRRGVALAQAAIGRARDTSLRLSYILDIKRPQSTRVFKPVLIATGAIAMLALAVVPQAPHLVSFQSPTVASGKLTYASVSMTSRGDLLSPKAIPAMAHIERTRALPERVAATTDRSHTRDPQAGDRIETKQRSQRPSIVQANLKQARPSQWLVLTQTTEFYPDGYGTISVTQWRVVLVNAPVVKSTSALAPKQT
jgi:beta-lactamase regulating signal transducer with metallopeptidase domain